LVDSYGRFHVHLNFHVTVLCTYTFVITYATYEFQMHVNQLNFPAFLLSLTVATHFINSYTHYKQVHKLKHACEYCTV